jgi:hypothetical protein
LTGPQGDKRLQCYNLKYCGPIDATDAHGNEHIAPECIWAKAEDAPSDGRALAQIDGSTFEVLVTVERAIAHIISRIAGHPPEDASVTVKIQGMQLDRLAHALQLI